MCVNIWLERGKIFQNLRLAITKLEILEFYLEKACVFIMEDVTKWEFNIIKFYWIANTLNLRKMPPCITEFFSANYY